MLARERSLGLEERHSKPTTGDMKRAQDGGKPKQRGMLGRKSWMERNGFELSPVANSTVTSASVPSFLRTRIASTTDLSESSTTNRGVCMIV